MVFQALCPLLSMLRWCRFEYYDASSCAPLYVRMQILTDHNAMLNNGAFLLRNNEFGHKFVRR